MKPGMTLHFTQQQRLSRQVQQSIRLLQLSAPQLEHELREYVEANPLLDWEEGNSSADSADHPADGHHDDAVASTPEAMSAADEFPGETDWHAADHRDFEPVHRTGSSHQHELDLEDPEPEDLHNHLLWQLNLSGLTARERAIGVVLIDAIDENGYMVESACALQRALLPELLVSEQELEGVRQTLMRFDPVGVGSRTLSECLLTQLQDRPEHPSILATASKIVRDHLPALAKRDTKALCTALGASIGMIEAACDVIRDLEPRPGSRIAPPSTEFVIPDAYAFLRDGQWEVKLSPHCQPRLSINHAYATLGKVRGSEEASYIRARHQEAQWLIRALETRAQTIQKVAGAILRNQHAFFENGPEALRPLTLAQVAAEVGLHESTISRVTTRKFLATPRGTFEFKYFFSSSLSTHDGKNTSATAIQATIRKLIDAERGKSPLTDIALSQAFEQRGIRVARRTVTKYRELLRIPPSTERVRHA